MTLQRGPYVIVHLDDLPQFGTGATAYVDCVVWEWINFRCQAESRLGTYEHEGVVWWRASLETLAEELHLSRDAVRRALDRLRESGLLAAEQHGLDGVRDRTMSYRPSGKSANSHMASVPHVPIVRSKERTTSGKSAYSDDFETFWSAYPRKDGKSGAWNHYRKLIASGVTVERLLSAAQGYADQVRREGTEPKYVKVAYNWFGQGMWEGYELKQPGDVLVKFLEEHSFAQLEQATGIHCQTPELGHLEFVERRIAIREFRDAWLAENRDRLAEALR